MTGNTGFVLFKKTQALEMKMTTFLLNIIQGGFLFVRAFEAAFENGIKEDFIDLKNQVSRLEAENDNLRREIENQLYKQMLLPNVRSDILHLLETCDQIINKYEANLITHSIEQPKIPNEMQPKVLVMIRTDLECVGALISGVKSFLMGQEVSDFVQHVYDLEHQVDLQAIELKEIVFGKGKLPLARQLQLRDFVVGIENISDMAERAADTLGISAIKNAL